MSGFKLVKLVGADTFWCRMGCLATVHSVTYRQTDDRVMPVADPIILRSLRASVRSARNR